MTRDRQIEAIRAACIQANPGMGFANDWGDYRPVCLADVLLVITNLSRPLAARGRHLVFDALVYWDLMQDDLTRQSDECIAYLARLLG